MGPVRSPDAGGSESSEDPSRGWFSRWGKWAALGAALLVNLGIAAVMVGSSGDDPVSEVASATTIRRDPEPSTTTSSPATTTVAPSTTAAVPSTSTTTTSPPSTPIGPWTLEMEPLLR